MKIALKNLRQLLLGQPGLEITQQEYRQTNLCTQVLNKGTKTIDSMKFNIVSFLTVVKSTAQFLRHDLFSFGPVIVKFSVIMGFRRSVTHCLSFAVGNTGE